MADSDEPAPAEILRTLEDGHEPYDVIIVGAGAAGVGVAIAVQHTGVENFLLVDRNEVGSSFWICMEQSPTSAIYSS